MHKLPLIFNILRDKLTITFCVRVQVCVEQASPCTVLVPFPLITATLEESHKVVFTLGIQGDQRN